MKVLLCLTLSVIISGCVNHLPGSRGQEIGVETSKEKKPELQISVERLPDLSSKHYQGYLLSFMNNTDRWLEFSALNARFPKIREKPTYLFGDKLRYYRESLLRSGWLDQVQWVINVYSAPPQSMKKSDEIFKNPPNSDEVQKILQSERKTDFQDSLPEGHFMKPFAVAPGLSISRWMVVRLPEDIDFQEMQVDIQDIHGNVKSFEVDDRVHERKIQQEAEKKRYRPN